MSSSSSCPTASTADSASADSDSVSSSKCPFSRQAGVPDKAPERCPIEEVQPQSMMTIVNQLGKARLSGFVTATATVGYVLCGGTSPLVAAGVTLGTYLQSLSANTANQWIEVEHDRCMKRTMFRPLVTGAISPNMALLICGAELLAGTALLAAVSYPSVAALGFLNWMLYVCVYTPLKRVSAVNTWYGAIVGAIPPIMGGAATAAAAGALSPAVPQLLPAYLLGAIMFAWQIPHFMSLSFHCRRDYEAAGYKMLAFENPTRASMYAVALSVVIAALSVPCVHFFVPAVEPWYYLLAAAANGVMIYKSWRFHVDPKRFCRACFVFSYIYLSVMLALLCINHVQPMHRAQLLLEYLTNDNKKKQQQQQQQRQGKEETTSS